MLFVTPRQRFIRRSTRSRMSRADLVCFLTVILIVLGIIALNMASHGIPAH